MVDINLFDDEPEEEQQEQGDQSFNNLDDAEDLDLGADLGGGGFDDAGDFGNDELSSESLDDALGFDDDISDADGLDADALMGEDLSDLDEGDTDLDDDYDFGGGRRKKTSPVVWIVMIIGVIFVAVYFFQPDLLSSLGGSKKASTRKISQVQGKSARSQGAQVKPQAGSGQPGAANVDSSKAPGGQPGAVASGQAPLSITASTKILNDLAGQGQFAMLMVDQDRFTVEYASAAKGAAETFGKRMQTLTGAASVISSPEDAHTVNGQSVYFGVISGKFDPAKIGIKKTGNPFANESEFTGAVKTKIQQQGLAQIQQKKKSSQTAGALQKINFEWIIEGDKAKVVTFLQSLNTLPGVWEPGKIRISPVELNDFKAQKVKLVLDLTASIGKVKAPVTNPAM